MNFTRQEKGEDSYMIPNGGASMLGKWGYFDAFEEILNQVISIVCYYYLLDLIKLFYDWSEHQYRCCYTFILNLLIFGKQCEMDTQLVRHFYLP